ncbi:MAG: hypothetical protein KAQ99_01560 [Candidatus Aureabacteria bacterium]|nr:hypothetical protein [Candidatus Auribacterota bacterium]
MSYRFSQKPDRDPVMIKNPEFLFVTDRHTGHLVKLNTNIVPPGIRPALWMENAHWMYNKYLTQDQVMQYLKKEPLGEELAYRLGKYVLIHTQNLATANWLIMSETPEDKQATFDLMEPCIRRLKAVLQRKPRNTRTIDIMIDICMEYAVDPF